MSWDAKVSLPDEAGGFNSGWEHQYSCRAEFIYSRGSEVVDAARLEGRSIFKIRIRQSEAARSIQPDWRMRDLRRGPQEGDFAGVEYNIREVDAITDRRWIFLVVESGATS